MKKVLMVIFVLSLLGLLATPVLAKVFEGGPSNETAPLPGGIRSVRPESTLAEGLIKEGPPPNELCPPPGTLRPAGGDEPVQVA